MNEAQASPIPMNVEKVESKSNVVTDSVTNTKQAACLVTLGLPLQEKGICIVYDSENPKQSTGGVAHFRFASDPQNTLRKFVGIYDEGKADVTLDEFLDTAKQDANLEKFIKDLEPVIAEAFMVWGRRFIENYTRLVSFLKDDAPQVAIIGGSPAYDDEGNLIGKQGFQVKYIPRKKASK